MDMDYHSILMKFNVGLSTSESKLDIGNQLLQLSAIYL